MTTLEIVLIALIIILVGVIGWMVVRFWTTITPEKRTAAGNKLAEMIRYLVSAYNNDGKIDTNELHKIIEFLVSIVGILIPEKTSAALAQMTGTENLLAEKTE